MSQHVYLIWNKNRTECVGFTDKHDAEAAAGIKPLGNPYSSLAGEWRDLMADEWNGEQPKAAERERFEMQKVNVEVQPQ